MSEPVAGWTGTDAAGRLVIGSIADPGVYCTSCDALLFESYWLPEARAAGVCAACLGGVQLTLPF